MGKFKLIALVAIVLLTLVSLMGCGGGGSSSMAGVTNIHANSVRPEVAFVYMDRYDNIMTDTTTAVDKSTSGWQDKAFQINYPGVANETIWPIIAFNDGNGMSGSLEDGKVQESELLGLCDLVLVKNSDDSYSLVDGATGVLAYADATKVTGRDVFIDCMYDRNRGPALTPAQIIERLKTFGAKLSKK